MGDVFRQVLDGDACVDLADVLLAEHQLVEGNIPGCAEGDFLNGLGHVGFSMTNRAEPLSNPLNPSQLSPSLLSLYRLLTMSHRLFGKRILPFGQDPVMLRQGSKPSGEDWHGHASALPTARAEGNASRTDPRRVVHEVLKRRERPGVQSAPSAPPPGVAREGHCPRASPGSP